MNLKLDTLVSESLRLDKALNWVEEKKARDHRKKRWQVSYLIYGKCDRRDMTGVKGNCKLKIMPGSKNIWIRRLIQGTAFAVQQKLHHLGLQ
jgi:hypothetical protein